jgi:hypothetical protein
MQKIATAALVALIASPGVVSANRHECGPGHEWGKKDVVNVMMVYEGGIPLRQFFIENYSDNIGVCNSFIKFVNSQPGTPVHFCQPSYVETCVPTAETRKRYDEILKKDIR